ncbi:MAG: ATP-binding cassette domain-containing protein [Planctomycetaceae bacterium]
MQIQEAERSGAGGASGSVSQGFGEHKVIDDFSTTVFRGDRVGIIGPNGAGKSTLLRDSARPTFRRRPEKLSWGPIFPWPISIRCRDQQLTKSLQKNVGDGTDFLLINGNKRHVVGVSAGFFCSLRNELKHWRFLSGERNRLLLAKMMSKPANVLVLDEPTNDLDAETTGIARRNVA